jgi:hypothetical protein
MTNTFRYMVTIEADTMRDADHALRDKLAGSWPAGVRYRDRRLLNATSGVDGRTYELS